MEEIIRQYFGGVVSEDAELRGASRDCKKYAEEDPWKGSAMDFISLFKSEMDNIAKSLSSQEIKVRVRFNEKKRCAELFVPEVVIADIVSYGEVGTPYELIVSSEFISEDSSGIFRSHIPANIEIVFNKK